MKIIFIGLLTTLLLIACKDEGGAEYLGKWVNVDSDKRTMEIVRNGSSYIVRNTEPSMSSGKFKTTNIPATLKDGTMQLNGGFGTVVLAVDRSTGRLVTTVGEFKKLN